MIETCKSLQPYMALYHGTSALLSPGDCLKPGNLNVVKKQAVFATTNFVKALACALLSKRGLQNKTVGEWYYDFRYAYCYLYDSVSRNLILHPLFHWDDGVPAFVYKMDPTCFFIQNLKSNELVSYLPARIQEVAAIVTPEYFKEQNVGLYVAKSENILADLKIMYQRAVSGHGLRKELMDMTCLRIV